MIVCYFGTYRKEYSRNKIMIAALRSAGVTVKECHVPLWHGIEDRVNITVGGWRSPSFWWRVIKAYSLLILKYFKVGDYDVLMVGYPGQVDVYLARLFTKIKKKPLVWDVLMSIYQVALERNLDLNNSRTVSWLKKLEQKACQLPEKLIIESRHYAKWFEEHQYIAIDKFAYVPLGADEKRFYPRPCAHPDDRSGKVNILYYGSFLPSHGIDLIIQAAAKLQSFPEYHFTMAGQGPELERLKVQAGSLSNTTFTGYLSESELQQQIACADICLGVFGNTAQSLMTVQNKIFECLAVQKTLLSGDSEPIREVLSHKENCYICQRDADSIVNSLLDLGRNQELRDQIAKGGYQLYQKYYNTKIIGKTLSAVLNQVLVNFKN